jgi:hypothetical protein
MKEKGFRNVLSDLIFALLIMTTMFPLACYFLSDAQPPLSKGGFF